MALQSKVGSFLTTTATSGNVSVTGVGFQGKVLMLWSVGLGSTADNDYVSQNIVASHGVALDSTHRFSIGGYSLDNGADAECSKSNETTTCLILWSTPGGSGTRLKVLDFVSWDADGFTLSIEGGSSANNYCVFYSVLGNNGSDTLDAEIGTITEPGATGNQAYSTTYAPGLVLLYSSGQTATGRGDLDIFNMLGAATGTPDGVVIAAGGNHLAATTDTNRHQSHCGDCICLFNATMSASDATASVVSFGASSFTLNWTARASTRKVYYLSLSGPRFALGHANTVLDTTTDIVVSGLGWKPRVGHVFWAGQGNQTTGFVSSNARIGYGAFTNASERACTAWRDADNQATTNTSVQQQSDEVLIGGTNTALDSYMDVKSIDSGGVTFIMDDADSGTNTFEYWFATSGIQSGAASVNCAATVACTAKATKKFSASVSATAITNTVIAKATKKFSASVSTAVTGSCVAKVLEKAASGVAVSAVASCTAKSTKKFSASIATSAVVSCVAKATKKFAAAVSTSAVVSCNPKATKKFSAAVSTSAVVSCNPKATKKTSASVVCTCTATCNATDTDIASASVVCTCTATCSPKTTKRTGATATATIQASATAKRVRKSGEIAAYVRCRAACAAKVLHKASANVLASIHATANLVGDQVGAASVTCAALATCTAHRITKASASVVATTSIAPVQAKALKRAFCGVQLTATALCSAKVSHKAQASVIASVGAVVSARAIHRTGATIQASCTTSMLAKVRHRANGAVNCSALASALGTVAHAAQASVYASIQASATAKATKRAGASLTARATVQCRGTTNANGVLEEGLVQYLSTINGLAPVYPVSVPQGASYPAISFFRVSTEFSHFLNPGNEPKASEQPVFQFDIWSRSYLEAQAQSELLLLNLGGYVGYWDLFKIHNVILQNNIDQYEPPQDGSASGVHHLSVDYKVLYRDISYSHNTNGTATHTDIHESLAQYLLSAPAITALVGSRIYPVALLDAYPAISWERQDAEYEIDLEGFTGGASPSYELTSYSYDYLQSKRIANAVKASLMGYRGIMEGCQVYNVLALDESDTKFPPVDGSDNYIYATTATYQILYRAAATV